MEINKKIVIDNEKILSNYKKLIINAKFRTPKSPIFKLKTLKTIEKKKLVMTCTF